MKAFPSFFLSQSPAVGIFIYDVNTFAISGWLLSTAGWISIEHASECAAASAVHMHAHSKRVTGVRCVPTRNSMSSGLITSASDVYRLIMRVYHSSALPEYYGFESNAYTSLSLSPSGTYIWVCSLTDAGVCVGRGWCFHFAPTRPHQTRWDRRFGLVDFWHMAGMLTQNAHCVYELSPALMFERRERRGISKAICVSRLVLGIRTGETEISLNSKYPLKSIWSLSWLRSFILPV
jgi:hypothetical protein